MRYADVYFFSLSGVCTTLYDYHNTRYLVRVMCQMRIIPGTYCIAICFFERGWWYAWYRYLSSAQETAVSSRVPYEVPFSSRCTTKSIAKKSPTGSLPPAVPTNVPPVDAHVWWQLHLSAVARCSDSYCIFRQYPKQIVRIVLTNRKSAKWLV